MSNTLIDFTGKRFGRLLVLSRANKRGDGRPTWNCVCDCGTLKVVMGDDLRKPDSRATRSCGCLQREHMAKQATASKGKRGHHFIHGAAGGYDKRDVWPEYRSWAAMWQRCTNPKHHAFMNYGGRGISVCEEWRDFRAFFAHMGKRALHLSLDRINNDGNYEPGNCRWATRLQQIRNQRPKKSRRLSYPMLPTG